MRCKSSLWCIGKSGSTFASKLHTPSEGYRNFYKQHALKGQKLLAQGNALGIKNLARRPVRAKALKLQANFKAFSLSGKMYGTYLRKFCQ